MRLLLVWLLLLFAIYWATFLESGDFVYVDRIEIKDGKVEETKIVYVEIHRFLPLLLPEFKKINL